jgi:hypothetical protein
VTVLAKGLAAQANTVQTLINDYAITGRKVIHRRAGFFNHTTDLMTKNLRIDIEWNRLAYSSVL